MLYFVLADLSGIDVMYQFSLTWFQQMFTTQISGGGGGSGSHSGPGSRHTGVSGVGAHTTGKKHMHPSVGSLAASRRTSAMSHQLGADIDEEDGDESRDLHLRPKTTQTDESCQRQMPEIQVLSREEEHAEQELLNIHMQEMIDR